MTALPYVDGNMLDGPMGEVFALDLSSATGRCDHCGTASPVGALRVYSHAPGLVARCPTCVEVVLRLVRAPDRAWLDLRGATFLQFPMPPDRPPGR